MGCETELRSKNPTRSIFWCREYVAYGFVGKCSKPSSPKLFTGITNKTSVQWRDLGWIKSDISNRTFNHYTYAKGQKLGQA